MQKWNDLFISLKKIVQQVDALFLQCSALQLIFAIFVSVAVLIVN